MRYFGFSGPELDRAAAINAIRISGMMSPADEDDPAVVSSMTTGSISMTGADMPPAKAAEARIDAAAAARTRFFMVDTLSRFNLRRNLEKFRNPSMIM